MYEPYFGFSGPPFQLNPDPSFYFNSRGHGRALAYLQYGAAQGEGFIVITGEIGAGKTTLVRMLLDGLDRQKVLPAQIVSTQLASGELLQSIITAFGIPSQTNSSKAHLIATLEAFLTALATQGRHALLIVDEAQNLEPRAVEELRMLSNFQLGNRSLLQSFLVGQPELRRLLESPSMEQLRQRVTASCHLGPLNQEESQAYIEHRLRRVGWTTRPNFEAGSFASLFRWTGGVPRRLNRLTNRVLLAAFLDGSDEITVDLVERTAVELSSEIGEGDWVPQALTAAPAGAPVSAAAPVPAVPHTVPAPVPAAPAAAVPTPILEPSPAPVLAEPSLESLTVTAADVAGLEIDDRAQAELSPAEPPVAALAQPVAAPPTEPAQATAVPATTVMAPAPAPRVVVRLPVAGRLLRKPNHDVLLCLADNTSSALCFEAVAQALSQHEQAPRMVLVSLGPLSTVWPWSRMGLGKVPPALEIGLDLEWQAQDLEGSTAAVAEGMRQLMGEFSPKGVLTLGSSDVMAAACMASKQCGLPVLRLEAGERPPRSNSHWNAALIEQMADLLFVAGQPSPLRQLQRQGSVPDRIVCVPGPLKTDALAAAWSETMPPHRVFLRNGLPIYLGPAWSAHDVPGSPYLLAACALHGMSLEAATALVRALVNLQEGKVVWVLDSASLSVLAGVLSADEALASQVCVVSEERQHQSGLREQMDAAKVLCRDIPSLPEQLSLLTGAGGAVLDLDHVLADGAHMLGLAHVCHDRARGMVLRRNSAGELLDERPVSDSAIHDVLALARLAAPVQALPVPTSVGAAQVVAEALQGWLGAHQAAA